MNHPRHVESEMLRPARPQVSADGHKFLVVNYSDVSQGQKARQKFGKNGPKWGFP